MKRPRSTVLYVLMTLLLPMMGLTACSLTQAPAPTPPPDYTPRPTPGGGANTIDVAATDFVQHALTVKHGTDVVFVVRMDSGPHILCLGKDGICDPSLPGPSKLRLDGGYSLDAGQSLTVTFTTPGVYPVTCSIYSSMNVVITVT